MVMFNSLGFISVDLLIKSKAISKFLMVAALAAKV